MKSIQVVLASQTKEFIKNLQNDAQQKLLIAIKKTQNGNKGDWFKKLKGTDDIWEFRVLSNRNHYRLLAFWDKRDLIQTLIICVEGFLKKTDKTPKRLIDSAESKKKEYFKM